MRNDYRIRVCKRNGREVLRGVGTLRGYHNFPNSKPQIEVLLENQQYPTKEILWLEAINGNIVLQAQVRVEYVFTHCGGSTTFKSVDDTVLTFDTRFDRNIPCGPCVPPVPRTTNYCVHDANRRNW